MWTFWCKNYRVFRNLWYVRTDKGEGGLSQCGHFADKRGGGGHISRFCADVFYGRPLIENTLTETVKYLAKLEK